MTSIRDLFTEPLAIGERFELELTRDREGRLVADHPNESSPADIVVVEGLDRLSEDPTAEPVEIKVVGRFEGGRLVGRVVGD